MPTDEAEYTYAVVPCLPDTGCLQTRGSPYTDIADWPTDADVSRPTGKTVHLYYT